MSILKVEKGWGHELIFANEPLYCGKILHFNTGEKTSMHFHAEKVETFYVLTGEYNIITIHTYDATRNVTHLMPGEKMDIPRLFPHQIVSVFGGDIIEVSTHDEASDSYRIEEGSSQRVTNTEQTLESSDELSVHQQITPDVEGDFEFRVSSATLEQEDQDRAYHLFEY